MGVANFHGSDFTRIVEMTPALRRRLEQTVEHLIALLDAYDGDPDLEPNLAGFQPAMNRDGAAACDLELDDSDDEDGGDDEPSLGWAHLHDGRPRPELPDDGADREAEPEHDEDGADDEPIMGWTVAGVCGQTFDNDEDEREDFVL